MARVLIVGCGCRGRALGESLLAHGHAVRGTSRDSCTLPQIKAAGIEAVVADPDRLGTVITQLAGVSVICWLLGSATGPSAPELHGARLVTLLERLVDTPVRGIVYESTGTLDPALLAAGASAVRVASSTWRMPAEVVDADPADHAEWVAATGTAVSRLL